MESATHAALSSSPTVTGWSVMFGSHSTRLVIRSNNVLSFLAWSGHACPPRPCAQLVSYAVRWALSISSTHLRSSDLVTNRLRFIPAGTNARSSPRRTAGRMMWW